MQKIFWNGSVFQLYFTKPISRCPLVKWDVTQPNSPRESVHHPLHTGMFVWANIPVLFTDMNQELHMALISKHINFGHHNPGNLWTLFHHREDTATCSLPRNVYHQNYFLKINQCHSNSRGKNFWPQDTQTTHSFWSGECKQDLAIGMCMG